VLSEVASRSRWERRAVARNAGLAPTARVESFEIYLAQAHGCRAVLRLELDGSPTLGVLRRLDQRQALVVRLDEVDLGQTLVACRMSAPGPRAARTSLQPLSRLMQRAPVGLLVVEDSNEVPGQVAERVHQAIHDAGLDLAFEGSGLPGPVPTWVSVLHGTGTAKPGQAAPDDFRVLAIVPAYNEADIIEQTLRDLADQGVESYLIDNWSTDGTVELARHWLGRGLVGIERFPAEGPSPTYDLSALMARVEDVAASERWPAWVMLHDADERRRSPWPGIRLKDALWHVDRRGYSCVDHVVLTFWPTDDSFDPEGGDIERQLEYFEFSDHPGHFHQRRAWKRSEVQVGLVRSAGHDVSFDGRRVYPYKFLLKHYPIRSEAHGRRKILQDRQNRWNPRERAWGWHRQYDQVGPGRFLRDPATLRRFDPDTFGEEYLVQRLSGVGVFREPPAWATRPRW
jgi:hypothetical protein